LAAWGTAAGEGSAKGDREPWLTLEFGTGLLDGGGGGGTWPGLLGDPDSGLCVSVELTGLGLGDRLGEEF
jgi:hypothetical protein